MRTRRITVFPDDVIELLNANGDSAVKLQVSLDKVIFWPQPGIKLLPHNLDTPAHASPHENPTE